ncbi:hypothetical protein GOBAR_AA30095 [Gossypium barbadense]|uniref:Malectin-like domain-containing protein n=1 Tax=Gossypium barbadense TaxID=3634 RepID=A0A2P5WHM3_GOSBA|nr:hypothetical protein GOBAR_AA30095 [Gossypium barbadense]
MLTATAFPLERPSAMGITTARISPPSSTCTWRLITGQPSILGLTYATRLSTFSQQIQSICVCQYWFWNSFFISSLEIRPSNISTCYGNGSSSELTYVEIYDLGSYIGPFGVESIVLKLMHLPHIGSGNLYKLPAEVLRTAVQPSNSLTGSFSFNSDYKYNVYFHFAEVEEFEDKVREISIALNGVKRGYLKPLSISFHKIEGEITFTIASAATMDSALPPILNALEFYQLKQFPLSATTHQLVMQSCPSSKRTA